MSQVRECRIDIVYRLPTYASGAFPRLAHELIERIADFLWDEPVQLARCYLVCCAWYHAARRHISRDLTIRSNNALRDLVHILMSKQNSRYGQLLCSLTISEDAEQSFAHTLSVRIPGCLLSSLGTLDFRYLDWTTAVRPHASFFTCLTYFTSVTQLYLFWCHFHSADEFHRIINGLPRLKHLVLTKVTIEFKQWEVSQATSRRRNSRLQLTSLSVWSFQTSSPGHSSEPIAHNELRLQQNHRSVLNELVSYSTIVSLQLTMHWVFSFSQLQQFIRSFPALREIQLDHNPAWDLPEVSTETALLRTDLSIDAWPMLGLSQMSSMVMLRFLELFTTQNRKVGRLDITVRGLHSSALLQSIEEVTRESGPALTYFRWRIQIPDDEYLAENSEIAPEPIPRLTYNINLETFIAHIFVLTISRTCTSLMTLLSYIKSTRLHSLRIGFSLGRPPLDDTDLSVEASIGSIAAFHAILSRPVFAGLPDRAVHISFGLWGPYYIEPSPRDTSANIKSIMVPLLAPWLARGVLQLHLPDGSSMPPEVDSAAPPTSEEESSAGDGALVE